MIKSITEIFSPSGNEAGMVRYLKQQLQDVCDEIRADNLGNLIATRKGKGKNLCFECGMDTRGVMIVAKEEDKVYFAPVGNMKPEFIVDKEIIFANGCIGTVKYQGENIKDAKISDLYIEMNTEKMSIGDFGVIKTNFTQDEEGFSAYGLGERIGIATVCEAVKQLNKDCGFTVLCSAQKRLGGRGLTAFFRDNEFDAVITVDGCKDKCEDGCLMIVKDAKGVAPVVLRNKVEKIATEKNIPITPAVSETNFFISTVAISGKGADCIGVGIPVQGDDAERQNVKKADFEAAVNLLLQIASKYE